MRDRPIPPEAHLYAVAFEAYLRAGYDQPAEESAAEWMSASLDLLARDRMQERPVRSPALERRLVGCWSD